MASCRARSGISAAWARKWSPQLWQWRGVAIMNFLVVVFGAEVEIGKGWLFLKSRRLGRARPVTMEPRREGVRGRSKTVRFGAAQSSLLIKASKTSQCFTSSRPAVTPSDALPIHKTPQPLLRMAGGGLPDCPRYLNRLGNITLSVDFVWCRHWHGPELSAPLPGRTHGEPLCRHCGVTGLGDQPCDRVCHFR